MFDEKIKEMNEQTGALGFSNNYEKRVYTVDEIMDVLSIGRNAAYDLVKSGAFHYVKIGGQYRISKKSFDKWLDNIDESQICD